jgi:predicted aspartyl protease
MRANERLALLPSVFSIYELWSRRRAVVMCAPGTRRARTNDFPKAGGFAAVTCIGLERNLMLARKILTTSLKAHGPIRRMAIGVAWLVASHSVAATTSTGNVATILAENQAATATPREGTLRLQYVYKTSGLVGTREATMDLASGAFIDTSSAGPISIGFGFDGQIPWMRDLSGAYTPQQGGDRIATSINDAYRRANLWWRKDRGGAAIVYVGREARDGVTLDHLMVTPNGGKVFDAWFDTRTHLLKQIAEMRQFFHTQTFFEDYRREGAITLAHAITLDPGVGKAHYETLVLDRVALSRTEPRVFYSCPTANPTGMRLKDDRTAVTSPFRLLNNHIYVTGRVQGKGPYTFIVDTGGHTLLSPRVVQAAGLDAQGKAASTGAGEKVSSSGFAQVGEMEVAGVVMRHQTAIVTNVYDTAIEGIPVDGMIGFEVFRRFAVKIDYGARTITFQDFKKFDPHTAGTALAFKFYDHLPDVEGTVDGIPARFDIDTGSRTEVDLTSPFVARENLRSRYSKGVSTITGWGVGGPSHDYVVRLPSLSLGAVRVDGVVAGLSEDKGGSISDPNYEGNIGGGLLKRFVVSFDYSHQRLYLKRLIPPPDDVGQFDRSGMWINAEKDGFLVAAVIPGGPASKSGILVGDLITRIDGRPAKTDGLSGAREMFRRRPDGTKLNLDTRRGSMRRSTTLILRDQI